MATSSAAGCCRGWTRPAALPGVERARGRVVTVALDAMQFIRPVRVGDVLEVFTYVESIGRTSMKIHVEAWARRFQTHMQEKVTDAIFTFVAIDESGRPRLIPKEV
jgi:acyl-CoA thioesterase YciA